jgi:hypothetical protein
MDEERRKQFKELIQTKVAADDADPAWMMAWIGFGMLDELGRIAKASEENAEYSRTIRLALTGPLHRQDHKGEIDCDMAITDNLHRIASAIAGRKQ